MSVLAYSELKREMANGRLIKNPRFSNGQIDLQPSSYDLMAGRAVWKDSKTQQVHETYFDLSLPYDRQPTVCLQPGQILAVITHEELRIPLEMCATVFSKNNLALKGIFAFNAGHVDPGYEGPIVIRMINLRSTPFTITMGQPVYTIVFHPLSYQLQESAPLRGRRPISMDETIKSVRDFADTALSNALFDLYTGKINSILEESQQRNLETIRAEMDQNYVKSATIEPQVRLAAVTVGLGLFALFAVTCGLLISIARFGPDIWHALIK